MHFLKPLKDLSLSLLLITNTTIADSKSLISINLNYILSALVYPNVIASDKGLRDLSNDINNWFGISAEIRYKLKNEYFVGLSIEVVDKKLNEFTVRKVSNQTLKIPTEDKFKIYIVELSLFFLAPFSSKKWGFYIGGGTGVYAGNFKKSIANAESEIQKKPFNLGIQVMSGVTYNFSDKFGIKLEFKFRDPIVEVESKFTNHIVNYNGYIIQLDPAPFRQKINFDTTTFSFGITCSI